MLRSHGGYELGDLGSSDLCVPIYLNQKIVFDMLAMIEDGFSQVNTLRTSTSDNDVQKSGYGGSFGISPFSFLGISFGGEKSSEEGSLEQQESLMEKVHTPASLFSKLRSLLDSESLLTKIEAIEDLGRLSSGQLVEFKAVLRKNPLFEYVDTFKQILDLAALFPEEQEQQQVNKQKGNKPRSQGARKTGQISNKDLPIYQQMQELRNALTQNGSLEIIGEMLDVPTSKAVLSTSLDCFIGEDSSEIIDGEFRVLGKAVRILPSDSTGSINLLRKTAFGRFNSNMFEELEKLFTDVQDEDINLPEFTVEVKAPTIQVIPVSIFV